MRILLAAALGTATGGCVFADDCGFEPIGASIRAPNLSPMTRHEVGACGYWVIIDGAYWTQSAYGFELDADTLEPIDEATAAAEGVTELAGATVYAIPGVDSAEAIAMERPDGTFVVFTADGSGGFPLELCPMFAQTRYQSTDLCDGQSPPPGG